MDHVTEFNREERKERKEKNKYHLRILCVLCGSILIACAAPTTAPTPTPNVGTVADQLARGAPLYAQNCATAACHGVKGEGIRAGNSFSAWPLVGAEFQARNPNAQVVFDVVRSGDEANLRAMTDQQIYDALAFEWRQTGASLTAPLTAQNAATTSSGDASANAAMLYPPIPSVTFAPTTLPPALPRAENGYLAMRVDQIAQASRIGNALPPNGGAFVAIVLALQDQTSQPLGIDPKFLRLYDSSGGASAPQIINFNSPIEQFHSITIQPAHGMAAIVVFALAATVSPDKLIYDDATGHPLTLNLK